MGEPTGTVVVRLTLATRAPVPVTVTQLRFTGFSASGALLYGPQTFPKASVITLTGVPIQVVNLQIDYLSGGVVTSMATSSLSLSAGGTQTIEDPGQQDVATVLRSIQVTPATPSVAFGSSIQMTATGLFWDGTTRDLTSLATWAVANPAAATVTSTGQAYGVASGSTVISASFGTVSGFGTLSVTGAVLRSIQVTPVGASVPRGMTRQFSAVGTYNDNTTQDLTSQVGWTTSSAGVASVNAAGLATGVGVGTCDVIARLSGVTGTTSFSVTTAVLQGMQVNPANVVLPNGLTRQLTATGTFSDASTQDLSSLVAWTTAPGGIATVSSSGLATGVAVGTTVVTATLNGTNGSTTLRVSSATPQSIQVAPAHPSVAKGATQQLTATATMSDATTLDVTDQVGWTTSPTGIATVSTTGLATTVVVGSTTVTATLSGVSGSTTLDVTPAVLRSIQVTPPVAQIPATTTAQFTATGIYSDATTQDVTNQVSWTTLPQGIATVSTSGLASGVSQGSTVVSAAKAGVASGFANLTVTPVVLQAIQITPLDASISNGTSQQFTAIGTFSDNTTRDLSTQVNWTTSPAGIATFSASGLGTGVAVGTTTVTATLSGVSASTGLTVKNVTLQSIQVTPTNASVAVGTTTQFTATGTFSDNTTQDLSGQVAWTASPGGIANFSTSGAGTAVGQGSTTVTASLNGVSDSTGLTVTAAVLQSIQVSPSNPNIASGTTVQLTATGVYSDSTTQDMTSQVSWTTSPSGIATVNGTGLATAVAVGATTVTATHGGVHGSTQLTVASSVVTSIQVTPADSSVAKGTTTQLTATGTFSDSTTQDLTNRVSWTTSPTGIATISASGLATAATQGTTTVRATLSGVSGTTSLTVTAATLQSIQITPANPFLAKGTTRQLTATGTYSDRTTQNLTTQVSWGTSPAGIATVSTAGLATAGAQGVTTVSATMGGVTGTTTLTVTAAALQSIQVTPATPSIPKGTTVQFTATGTFSDSTTQNLSTQVSWTTSPTGPSARVSLSTAGLATGTSVGFATVSATLSGVTGSTNINVTTAVVQSIAVTPANTTIAKGSVAQLTATATFSDATTQDVTGQASWTTSPTGFASVDTAGRATGTALGSTTVTATLRGISGSTSLTVVSAVLQSIAVTPANRTVATGTALQLTATGRYSDGTFQDLTTQVSWTTSPAGIVTVNGSGLATGVGVGTTAVTGTLAGVSGATNVTVTNATLQSIAVTPASATMGVGSTVLFTATGTFSDSSTQDLSGQVSWTTSPTGIAAVSAAGVASRVAVGSTTVTATLSGKSGSAALSVTNAVLQSIAVTPANPTIPGDTTLQFTATGTFLESVNVYTTQDLTRQATWASSNTGQAVVSNTGLVTGILGGTPTISATLSGVTGSTTLTVTNPPGAVWTGRTSGTTNSFYRVSYGNGRFVAVGLADQTSNTGTLVTSSNGTDWTVVNPGTTSSLLATTYGNGTYVVAGGGGTVLSSTDAAGWTARVSGTTSNLLGACYGIGTFVVVGASGTVITSADGSGWTVRTSNTANRLQGVGFGNNTFVAVGDSGTIITSVDGVGWTTRASNTGNNLSSVAYSSGLFVAVGQAGTILTSPDGVTWTVQTSGTPNFLRDVTYGSGVFVVSGELGTVLTSANGVAWVSRNSGTGDFLLGVTFGNGRFVAVGQSGAIVSSP